MNTAFTNGASLPEELQCCAVSQACAELMKFWNEVNEIGQGPKWEQMGDQLNQFRSVLAEHFAADERALQNAGLTLDADGRQQFRELQSQSMQILDQVIEDVDHLKTHDATFPTWSRVAEELQEIMDRIAEHERLNRQMKVSVAS